jgi:hypothetical protein
LIAILELLRPPQDSKKEVRVQEFISEDDLNTFEGWLKYQGGDGATISPDQSQ